MVIREMWPLGSVRALGDGPAVDADLRLRLATIALARGLLCVALIADGLQVALVVVVHADTIECDHLVGGAGLVDDVVDSIRSSSARGTEAGLAEV